MRTRKNKKSINHILSASCGTCGTIGCSLQELLVRVALSDFEHGRCGRVHVDHSIHDVGKVGVVRRDLVVGHKKHWCFDLHRLRACSTHCQSVGSDGARKGLAGHGHAPRGLIAHIAELEAVDQHHAMHSLVVLGPRVLGAHHWHEDALLRYAAQEHVEDERGLARVARTVQVELRLLVVPRLFGPLVPPLDALVAPVAEAAALFRHANAREADIGRPLVDALLVHGRPDRLDVAHHAQVFADERVENAELGRMLCPAHDTIEEAELVRVDAGV